MTTALLGRPGPPAPPAAARAAKFTGTLRILRLCLRRDRIVAPLWILLLSVPLATVYVGSVGKVYPTDADRAGMVASIMASPMRSLTEPPGLKNSTLAKTGVRAPSTTRRRRTSGVQPIVSRTFS